MKEIDKVIGRIIEIRDSRDWKQFHNPKDLAISLLLEAGEVLEHFQWKSKEEAEEYIKMSKKEIGEELADTLYWVLLMSHDLDIDIFEAIEHKLDEIESKYSIEKSKGNHKKYNQL